MRFIIATKNKNKLREIRSILRNLGVPIVSLNELESTVSIKETGKTFFDNALKKAVIVSKKYPHDLIIGEDSGLEVECLGGAPGIFSKRYSGKNANDIKNNKKLLKELTGIPWRKRKAQFRCVAALVKNNKLIKKVEGCLRGIISTDSRGRSGFGYDPVFYLPGYKKTVAQLSLYKKNEISHRARAFGKMKKFLASYLKNK